MGKIASTHWTQISHTWRLQMKILIPGCSMDSSPIKAALLSRKSRKILVSSDEEELDTFGREDKTNTPFDCAEKTTSCSASPTLSFNTSGRAKQSIPPPHQAPKPSSIVQRDLPPLVPLTGQSVMPSHQSSPEANSVLQWESPSQVLANWLENLQIKFSLQGDPGNIKTSTLIVDVSQWEDIVINVAQLEEMAWNSEEDNTSVTSMPDFKRGHHQPELLTIIQAIKQHCKKKTVI